MLLVLSCTPFAFPLRLFFPSFPNVSSFPTSPSPAPPPAQILGVERRANDRAIKKAYRQLSKLYHPDKNKGEEAEKKFQDLAAAYETLSDKEKRRVYDQGGEEALKQGGGQQRDPFDMFSHFGGGFGGHGHMQNQEERRGEDVRLDLTVTLEDLYKGKVYEVQLKQQHLCHQCRGTGARKESDIVKCNTCQGRGVTIKMVSLGPGFMQQMQAPCDACQGKGKIIKAKCPKCAGRKVEKGTKKLDVMVEIGMPDGHKIEFENAADEHPDHAAGHVIFTVNTLPHPRFVRKGNDLHVTEQITLLEVSEGDRGIPGND
jgi:DnaJ-related protein SCJ1